jgi:flagellar protein FlgJ
LHEVAQQFEAIFVRQMLAEARKSNMGDTLFSNQGTDTFREMQEQTGRDRCRSRALWALPR